MRTPLLLILLATGCASRQVVPTESRAAVPPAEPTATRVEVAPAVQGSSVKSATSELVETTLLFEFDQSVLQPQSARVLQGVAETMRADTRIRISIAGHSDDRGTTEYNLALGQQRAMAAKKYLVALGVEPERISTTSFGEETPAVSGQTEEAYAANRRDVIHPQ